MDEKKLIKFFKGFDRMCATFYGPDCCCPKECPMQARAEENEEECPEFMINNPEKAVPIILQWIRENPVRTRMVDFMEKHPNAPLSEKGYPKACAKTLGYVPEEKFCRTPCGVCWETDVEDE